jgi:hypothetical protein
MNAFGIAGYLSYYGTIKLSFKRCNIGHIHAEIFGKFTGIPAGALTTHLEIHSNARNGWSMIPGMSSVRERLVKFTAS